MTPADALDAAARYIDEHGWVQGALSDDAGRVCAEGGIRNCTNDVDVALAAFRDYLGVNVGRWNDEPHRIKEQVVKELRACAQILRDEQ